jgi:hypothetical protein
VCVNKRVRESENRRKKGKTTKLQERNEKLRKRQNEEGEKSSRKITGRKEKRQKCS